MNILVLGSKGFIGRHCVSYFSKTNDVWECDVIMDYDKPKYIFVEATDSDFNELFSQQQFDVCINCSGAANVPFSLDKPINDFQLNAHNVFKILEAIRKYNPECRFINLSSAAVYGNPKEVPIKEEIHPAPVSPYGVHKLMAEMACREYHKFWNLKTCCLRIFSAYGPGLKKQILWDLVQKAKAPGDYVELFGTGNETRDFIYIEDLVRLLDLVIQKSNFEAEIINAANGEQIKISTIAELTLKAMGSDKHVRFKGVNRAGDPLYWEADISKSLDLGYERGVSIEQGIGIYISWLEDEGLL